MLNTIIKLIGFAIIFTTNLISLDFEERNSQGKIEYDNLDEISGLVFGNTNPDIIWAVNDGRADEIYGIDRNGNSVTTLDFKKEILPDDTDIEDISVFQFGGINYIVLADIGDNNEDRAILNLFFIPEPKYNGSSEIKIEEDNILKVEFEYSDGSRDAECIFIDPISNNIYIVTKREKKARLYELSSDFSFTKLNSANFILEFEFGNNINENSTGVTAGDISKDGKHILIRDYTSVWYFENNTNNIIESLKSSPSKVKSYTYQYNKEPQGESICWDSNLSGFYTASEEKSFDNFETDLFYFKRTYSSIKKKNDIEHNEGYLVNSTNKSIEFFIYNIIGQKLYSSFVHPNSKVNIKELNIKAQYLMYDNQFYKLTY